MSDDAKLLDFVKAVSDADRLRIIGLLAQHSATTRQIAEQLRIPFREAFAHLGQLEFAAVVRKAGDSFELNDHALESLSRQQFAGQRTSYVPSPDLPPKVRKTLTTYLNPDGSLKEIPMPGTKLRIVLDYLVSAFEPGVQYGEKEVNTILRRFHADTATLRRALIDSGLLDRESDGSRYWRPARDD